MFASVGHGVKSFYDENVLFVLQHVKNAKFMSRNFPTELVLKIKQTKL